MRRFAILIAGASLLLPACTTNQESLDLAREVSAALDAYDTKIGDKVAEQNRFYTERTRDHARAAADLFPGRRDQLRTTRAITTASHMAGAPSLRARRGNLVAFLLQVAADERELDRAARQQAAEAERSFRAALRTLEANRTDIRRARRSVEALTTRPRRRDEAAALLRYVQELKKEIDRERP